VKRDAGSKRKHVIGPRTETPQDGGKVMENVENHFFNVKKY